MLRQVRDMEDVNYNFQLLDRLVRGNISGEHLATGAIEGVHMADGSVGTRQVDRIEANKVAVRGDRGERIGIHFLANIGDMAFEDMVEEAMLGETIIEGGYIRSNMLHIDGGTLFGEGYDPTGKLDEEDAGSLAFEDMVEKAMLGETIIIGGKIKTELLTADNIRAGTLSGVTIDVDTDLTVGENIYMASNTLGDGIDFGGYGSIEIEPPSNLYFQSGAGSSMWLGTRLHVPDGIHVPDGDVEVDGDITAQDGRYVVLGADRGTQYTLQVYNSTLEVFKDGTSQGTVDLE